MTLNEKLINSGGKSEYPVLYASINKGKIQRMEKFYGKFEMGGEAHQDLKQI